MLTRIGRNERCPCLSGLKYKRCCGRFATFDADGNTYTGHVALNDGSAPEVGSREGQIIVKVQIPLESNQEVAPALIYDRGRTFRRHVPLEEVAARMAGRAKAFFYARLTFGQIVLGDEAPSQGW